MAGTRKIIFVGAALALLALATPFASSYVQILITQSLIFGILAMSLDILLGYTGLPSMGHAAYLGVAAYTAAILVTRYQVSFWVVLPLGILLAAALAALFGLLAIRATGVYFLMITLALGMVVWGLAYRWNSLTGGDNGIAGIPRPDLGLGLQGDIPFFYFVLFFFLLCLVALYILVRSPFGRSLVGIREGEARMRMLGYNVWLHKYLAFILAGGFGGVSGVFWAYYNGFVSPPDVELVTSVEVLLMVALGGPGTLVGPVLGAAVVVFLRNFVSIFIARWPLILGAIYILTILYAQGGIMGVAAQMRRSLQGVSGKGVSKVAPLEPSS